MKDKSMTASEMGKRGNRARNKSLNAAQRKELSRRAAKIRWAKAKKQR